MPDSFNLREWQDARDLTAQQLTDYLNGLGCPVARKTVEGWHGKGCPKWLPPLLRQRDVLNALYPQLNTVHEAVIDASHGLVWPDKVDPVAALDEAGKACDRLKQIFEQYLTPDERGVRGE